MTSVLQAFDLNNVHPDRLLPFNFRRVEDAYFISNDLGEYAILSAEEFKGFVEGDLPTDGDLFISLGEKGFIAGELSEPEYYERYWSRRNHVMNGPILHAFVLTERCNFGCQYCHSSIVGMKHKETDMSIETAEQCVDFALTSASPAITIEFQGGEPLVNWDVLMHIVQYAREKNQSVGKTLTFSLVTNMSLMTEEKLDFLIESRVQICTSIDGPEELHNKVRIYKDDNSWQLAQRWLKRVNERYVEQGLDPVLYQAEALPTITRHALGMPKEIVDTYVEMGCRAIFIRVLDPFGFAASSSKKLGYSMDEFLEFYIEALDYIIELNKQGTQVMERLAAIMLSKMIGGYDPNYLDLRSPGGCVIGQLAYHPSGNLYTSDEGRMVAAMGDDFFHLGHVKDLDYREMMGSSRVRAMILASTNEGLPGCESCAYKLYCGQQPEYNYVTQGSLQGRMPESTWCQKHMGIFDHLVKRLKNADEEEKAILQRWTINRAQDHFLQD
ncbi:MAG: His-Xaa-Ser system radical SAM maturase HxsB [Bradymonadia bacterium]|jgi:His-Xaa-Ser system radical SAM maturase HxsB